MVTPGQREAWLHNRHYPKGSVGRLMEPVVATFVPTLTVSNAVEGLRDMVKQAFVTYGYEHPVSMKPTQQIAQVIPLVHTRHFPEYPVCDDDGRIIGIVRGYALFQEQTLELISQPGKMVGIGREEHIQTNAWRSIHLRHPWLQVNLLSSFLAAGVVGFYEETIVQVVAAAAFLPVMVGQSASTGGQALAVALRGLMLEEFTDDQWHPLINKEALVGIANGAFVA
jgi:magnesium transporter